jgi:hypothetical protein
MNVGKGDTVRTNDCKVGIARYMKEDDPRVYVGLGNEAVPYLEWQLTVIKCGHCGRDIEGA